jgi:hypothetical protein
MRPVSPSRQRLPPTLQSTIRLCPQLPRHRYRTCSGSQRRSLWVRPGWPSSRPPPFAASRLASSAQGTVRVPTGARAHWRGNAGWSYVGSQYRGSSARPRDQGALQPRASGWVHLPTSKGQTTRCQLHLQLTRSVQKPPLRSINSKKSLYSLLWYQSSLAISKLLQKWHML